MFWDTSASSMGTAAACCCGSEPCTGHRTFSFTHCFPLGEGTSLLPKKLSLALRDLAEAQEIPLLCFSLRWLCLPAVKEAVYSRERAGRVMLQCPSHPGWAPVPLPTWCKVEMTFREKQSHLWVKHLDLCTRHCVATLQITHVSSFFCITCESFLIFHSTEISG